MDLRDENAALAQRLAATEERLRESETRHRLLTESWAQAVWETDPAGVVVADSPSWRAYTGQTLEEWLGYGWLDAIHPDDRAYAERQWREAVAADGLVDAEFRLRAPDGGWRWTNVRAAPARDAAGEIRKWVGINLDVDDRRRAEEALRRSETRLQLALEAGDLAIYEWDLLADRLVTNDRYRELVGLASGNPAIGADVMDCFVHPADRDRIDLELARAMDGTSDGRFAFEHRLSRAGPVECPWVLSHGQVQFQEIDGERIPVRVFGTLHDITERKRAEAELRDSEERQAFLLRLSDALRAEPDGAAVANRAIRILLDHLKLDRCYVAYYRPDEDAADIPYQVGNDSVPPLPPSVRLSDFPDAYEQVLERTFVIDDDWERRGLSEAERANSKALGMRAMLASTIRRGDKMPLGSLVAVSSRPRRWRPTDITLIEAAAERIWAAIERVRAENRLRESEERLRLALDVGHVAAWDWDLATGKVQWSDEHYRMHGYAVGETTPSYAAWASRVHPDDLPDTEAALQAAREGAGDYAHEFRSLHPDGVVRWLSAHGRVFRDETGAPRRMVGATIDVTERREWGERQKVLLAELQHRVRNILAIVRSVVSRSDDGERPASDYVQHLQGRLSALGRTQVLLTRRAGVGIDLEDMIRDELLAQIASEKQFTLDGPEVELSPKAAEVLALAIHELATNATKYGAFSRASGRLAVTWKVELRDGQPWLSLLWAERGVPIVDAVPRRQGFGSELIQRRIPYELQGAGRFVLKPGGLESLIEFPLRAGNSVLQSSGATR